MMNGKPEINAVRITRLLNCSVARIDQSTLARLSDARMQALGRHTAHQAAPAFTLAHIGQCMHHRMLQAHYRATSALIFVTLLLGAAAWWQLQPTEYDDSDVDIAILTDDLPIDVYVE